MAITNPRNDIFSTLSMSSQSFKLQTRSELSRRADGGTKVKSFGSAIWTGTWKSVIRRHDTIIDWEAVINSLDGGSNAFYAGDLRRQYPMQYPSGAFTDSGLINSLGANNKSISLKSLPANFKISRGDYFMFKYGAGNMVALHQVMESIIASGSGLTGMFEIRPFLRVGVVVNAAVTFKKPMGLFTLDPASISMNTEDEISSSLSFGAVQWPDYPST